MKFVGFNLKQPKVNNSYGNILDDLGKECELKVCSVGQGLVFTTKDSITKTSCSLVGKEYKEGKKPGEASCVSIQEIKEELETEE